MGLLWAQRWRHRSAWPIIMGDTFITTGGRATVAAYLRVASARLGAPTWSALIELARPACRPERPLGWGWGWSCGAPPGRSQVGCAFGPARSMGPSWWIDWFTRGIGAGQRVRAGPGRAERSPEPKQNRGPAEFGLLAKLALRWASHSGAQIPLAAAAASARAPFRSLAPNELPSGPMESAISQSWLTNLGCKWWAGGRPICRPSSRAPASQPAGRRRLPGGRSSLVVWSAELAHRSGPVFRAQPQRPLSSRWSSPEQPRATARLLSQAGEAAAAVGSS